MATANEAEKKRHALRRRRRLRQILGAVVCVLVLIGLSSVISSGVRLAAQLFDDTKEREEFEQRLQTLVSLDPEPFESLETANRARLLDAAIWSVIQQNSENMDAYERDEAVAMYLPTLDVDKELSALYGPDFQFTHETFTDNGLTYTYVPEKSAYLLPITSANGVYLPRVMEIRRISGGKRVTIGYLDIYGSGEIVFDITKLEPVKYLDYIFTRVSGKYYLTAIAQSEMSTETGNAASNAPQTPATPQGDVMSQVATALPDAPDSEKNAASVGDPAPEGEDGTEESLPEDSSTPEEDSTPEDSAVSGEDPDSGSSAE